MIGGRHHQPARDGPDAAFDDARVMVENEAVDPRIGEERPSPRQTDGIVAAQQFLHRPDSPPARVAQMPAAPANGSTLAGFSSPLTPRSGAELEKPASGPAP